MGSTGDIGSLASIALTAVAASAAAAAAPPSVAGQAAPLDSAAKTEEIVQAIGNCMQAVGPNRSVNPSKLDQLGWTRLPSPQAPGEGVIGQYSRGNVVNEIALLQRAAGCKTKAKLATPAQIGDIRVAMIAQLGLAGFDEYQGKAGFKAAMLQQFGDSVRDKLLFKAGNSFTIEPTGDGAASFVVITNVTDAAPTAPTAN
jgi:hypothetical protein